MSVQTWHIAISEPECIQLLTRSTMGRLGVIVDGRPEIFPVNHVYDDASGCIVFPTNEGTKYRASLDWPWVAYEIDGLEPDDQGGWSVAIVGRAEEITDASQIARAAEQRHVLWAGGEHQHWLRIVPSKTTGQRISAVVLS
jgi:uncharacterized protein